MQRLRFTILFYNTAFLNSTLVDRVHRTQLSTRKILHHLSVKFILYFIILFLYNSASMQSYIRTGENWGDWKLYENYRWKYSGVVFPQPRTQGIVKCPGYEVGVSTQFLVFQTLCNRVDLHKCISTRKVLVNNNLQYLKNLPNKYFDIKNPNIRTPSRASTSSTISHPAGAVSSKIQNESWSRWVQTNML